MKLQGKHFIANNFHLGLLLLLMLGLVQCKPSVISTPNYVYTDMNNNRFFISSETLTYAPISAKESSSGTYDGGEKATVSLAKEHFKKISQMSDSLLAAGPFIEKRAMLTSILSKKQNDTTERRILARSKKRTEFEHLLRSFLSENQ